MDLAVLLVILAAGYLIYKLSQTTTEVEVAADELGTTGHLDAIEYFWRPG